MITIELPAREAFDPIAEVFCDLPKLPSITLEHSLIAIAKWEAKYKIPFLKSVEHLGAQKHKDKFLYYISCMSIKGDLSDEVLGRLTADDIKKITEYIADPHTASILPSGSRGGGRSSRNVPTAERIYAMMAVFRIPYEYSRWHINNLLAVIEYCREYNEDPSKKKTPSQDDVIAFYEQNEKMRKMGMAL